MTGMHKNLMTGAWEADDPTLMNALPSMAPEPSLNDLILSGQETVDTIARKKWEKYLEEKYGIKPGQKESTGRKLLKYLGEFSQGFASTAANPKEPYVTPKERFRTEAQKEYQLVAPVMQREQAAQEATERARLMAEQRDNALNALTKYRNDKLAQDKGIADRKAEIDQAKADAARIRTEAYAKGVDASSKLANARTAYEEWKAKHPGLTLNEDQALRMYAGVDDDFTPDNLAIYLSLKEKVAKMKPASTTNLFGSVQPRVDTYGNIVDYVGSKPDASGRIKTFESPPLPTGDAARRTPVPDQERSDQSTFSEMYKDTEKLNKLYNANNNFVDPIHGNWVKLTRRFVSYPEQVNEMYTIAENLENNIVYLRSGKQINENELKRLKRVLPNPAQPREKFTTDLAKFQEEFRSIYKKRFGKDIAPPSFPISGSNPRLDLARKILAEKNAEKNRKKK